MASKAVVAPLFKKDENGKKPFGAASAVAAAGAEGTAVVAAGFAAAAGAEPGAEFVFGQGAGVGSGTVCATAGAAASAPPTNATTTTLAPLVAISVSPRIVRTPVTDQTANRALWRIRG